MIETGIELPKVNYFKLGIGALIVIGVSLLNLLQFGRVFGTNIWPFAIIWLLPSIGRYGFNGFMALLLFALGILQDLILGQKLGIFGAINVGSYGILAAFFAYLPVFSRNSVFETLIATLAFLIANFIIGIFIGNIPNLLGLLIPLILSVIIGQLFAPFFEIIEENS